MNANLNKVSHLLVATTVLFFSSACGKDKKNAPAQPAAPAAAPMTPTPPVVPVEIPPPLKDIDVVEKTPAEKEADAKKAKEVVYVNVTPEIQTEVNVINQEIQDFEKLDDVLFHRAAFTFVYRNPTGLNFDSWALSKFFADELVKLEPKVRAIRLAVYRYAFNYAYRSAKGLKMESWSAARDFAEKMSELKNGATYVVIHSKAFYYAARDPRGLKMESWNYANFFAEEIAKLPNGPTILQLHREAFQYAYVDKGGLEMEDWNDAKNYADEISGFLKKAK